MRIEASVQSTALEGVLKELMAALDPTEILDEAQAILLNRIRTRFLAGVGPDGPWVPSKAGLKRKAGGYTYRGGKKYSATGTLFETGTLFHSIQAQAGAGDSMVISSDVPYGRYHQFGSGGGRRVFLGFNDEDIDLVVRLIRMRIGKALA